MHNTILISPYWLLRVKAVAFRLRVGVTTLYVEI